MAAGTIAAKTGADALSDMVMDEHHSGNVYSPITVSDERLDHAGHEDFLMIKEL